MIDAMSEICFFTLICADCDEVYGFYRLDDEWGEPGASDLAVFATEVSHEALEHHWVLGQLYIGDISDGRV